MSASVIDFKSANAKRLKSILLDHRAGSGTADERNELFQAFHSLFHLCATADAGVDRVNSFQPYVRIHGWSSGFRVVVSCYSSELAEWTSDLVTQQETQARIRGRIPWHQILYGGLHWYGDLDPNGKYWRILLEEILGEPGKTDLTAHPLKRRGLRVERKM